MISNFITKFFFSICHFSAFSNMPILDQTQLGSEDGYEWVETKFEETLTMSSYLVAITLADYYCKNTVVKGLNGNNFFLFNFNRLNARLAKVL